MATSGGVRSWIGMMPVARSSSGAAWQMAPSVENASVPVASTVQTDE